MCKLDLIVVKNLHFFHFQYENTQKFIFETVALYKNFADAIFAEKIRGFFSLFIA